MKAWQTKVYGNLRHKKQWCVARLMGIQKELALRPSRFLSTLESELLHEYHQLSQLEDSYWRQKSTLQWMAEGEKNTHFFHRSVNMRRQQKNILSLKCGGNEWYSDQEELKRLVREYYVKLYTGDSQVCQEHPQFHFPVLSHNDRNLLNRPVTVKEIETALFQMGPNKAPGPDGFPLAFFQRN